MADAQGSQLLFFLPRAVDEAIPEAMRGRVLSWNVQRGEEGRVLFFWLQGVVLIRRWGSDFFFCWIILLVLRSCWLGGAANCGHSPSGGRGACASPPSDEPPLPSDSPNLGVPMQRNGSHDENLLVGASPVVDYFAFVLENLANSALHRVLGRFGEAVGSKTRRSCFK